MLVAAGIGAEVQDCLTVDCVEVERRGLEVSTQLDVDEAAVRLPVDDLGTPGDANATDGELVVNYYSGL